MSPTCPGYQRKCSNKKKTSSHEYCNECLKTQHEVQREVQRRCPNYDQCEGHRRWDKENEVLIAQCNKCIKQNQLNEKLCLYHTKCGGYRGWDTENDCRFPLCFKCTRLMSHPCPNFEQCGDYRTWNRNAEKLFDVCKLCHQASQTEHVKTTTSATIEPIVQRNVETEEEKRCPNYNKCFGYKGWNKDTGSRFSKCRECLSRCPRFSQCGGYKSWDHRNNCYFRWCKNCM
jgi:hypothetical protein